MHHASQPSSPASQASHPLEAPSRSLTSAPAGPGPDTPSSPALLSGWHLAQERRRREKHLEVLEQERRQVARLLDDAFLVLGMAVRPSSGTNGPAAATEFHQQLEAARAQHSALLAQHAALRQREAAVQQEMARLSAAQDVESARRRLQGAQETQRLAADVAGVGNALATAAQQVAALERQMREHQQVAQATRQDVLTRAIQAGWQAFSSGHTEGLDGATVEQARTLLQRHQELDAATERARDALADIPRVSRLAYAVGVVALVLSFLLALVGLAYGHNGAPVLWGSLAALSAVHLLPQTTPGWGLVRLTAWPTVFFWWGVTVETGFRQDSFPLRTVVAVALSAAILLAVFLRQRAQGHSPGPWGAVGLVVCTLLVPLHAQGVLERRRADRAQEEAQSAASAAQWKARDEARRQETLTAYGSYLAQARAALEGRRLDDARELLFRLGEVRPEDAEVTSLRQQLERLDAAQRERERRRDAAGPCIEACNQKCGQEMTRCFGLYGQEAPICEPLVTATRQCLPMCPGICGTE